MKIVLLKGNENMTPEDEIVEIVKRTIHNKLVSAEIYKIQSFPQLRITRMPNTYSVRLGTDYRDIEMCVRRYEILKNNFTNKVIVFKNLILERTQSIALTGQGKVVINSPHYYDCIFTNQEKPIENYYCYNCVVLEGN